MNIGMVGFRLVEPQRGRVVHVITEGPKSWIKQDEIMSVG